MPNDPLQTSDSIVFDGMVNVSTAVGVGLLFAVIAGWLLWRERRHHADASVVRGAALAVAGWALVYGPWLAYAWSAFGRFTPETAAAKSYGLTVDPVFLAGHLFATLKQFAIVQVANQQPAGQCSAAMAARKIVVHPDIMPGLL